LTHPTNLPFEDFGGAGAALHFAHANGYPPLAYRPLLERLSAHYKILSMRMRPLWPASDPSSISDWQFLADDLAHFLDQHNLTNIIGAGHSMGATTTLRLALRQPERFKALILIDPVIFSPAVIRAWNLIYLLGLADRVHPLVKGTLRRRTCFENRTSMFENYRTKKVFSRMDDSNLHAYVEALACPDPDGQIRLCYPAEWEARIYLTGVRADMEIWRGLSALRLPVLFIRGSESDTFLESTVRRLQKQIPDAQFVTIPDSTHLVALEKPGQVFTEIIEFLSQG
jgi:pimeloyl-ACP methyl ester carboxylesterase